MFKQSSLPKLGTIPAARYNESDQKNALRWVVCFYDEEKHELIPQSGIMKCKDYFNDLVAKKNGVDVDVYGFNTARIKLNDSGVYMLLKYVRPSLIDNLNKWLNPKLEEEVGTVLDFQQVDPETYVFFFPEPIWQSTYHISLCSLMLRLSNYNKVVESYEEAWEKLTDYEPIWKDGQYLQSLASKLGWKLPKSLSGFWLYRHKEWHSKKEDVSSNYEYKHIIHNNGIYDWSCAIKNEGLM